MDEQNGWKEWSKYVLKELERLNSSYEDLRNRYEKLNSSLVMLQTKASIWGAVAGFSFSVIATYVMKYAK